MFSLSVNWAEANWAHDSLYLCFVIKLAFIAQGRFPPKHISELKIQRRRDSTTADLVKGAWGEVAVTMAWKIALGKLARRQVVVASFPVDGYF